VAFSKEKAHERAERHAARGQHDRAAREYQSIVDNDPKDIRAWLMLADCLARSGDRATAVARYLQVAEFYASQKAHQKALAVYRQVLTLEPSRLDVHFKTATLNRELGRVHDAIASYEHIAQAQMQAGRTDEALKTYRVIADSDPSIVSKRLRLAELYSRENRLEEAVASFTAAGRVLLETNRLADYVRVAERLLYHREDDRATIRELARVYLKLGDARRALMKLNALLQMDHEDVIGLELLGDTFMAMGRADKASSVMVELIRKLRSRGREGEHDAIRVLNKARQWDPRNAELVRLQHELEHDDGREVEHGVLRVDDDVPSIDEIDPPEEGVELMEDDLVELDEDDFEEEAEPHSVPAAVYDEAPTQPTSEHDEDFDKVLFEARVYVKYRLFDHALEHVQELLAQQPRHVGALSLRARALTELGRRVEAGQAHIEVAELLWGKDVKLALEHVEAALECDPQRSDAPVLRRRLLEGGGASAPAPAAASSSTLVLDEQASGFDLVDEAESDFSIEVSDFEDESEAPSTVRAGTGRQYPVEDRFGLGEGEPQSPPKAPPSRPPTPDRAGSLSDRLLDEPSERVPLPVFDDLGSEPEPVEDSPSLAPSDDEFAEFELDPEAFADVDINIGAHPSPAPSKGAPSKGAPSKGAPSKGAPSKGAPSKGAPSKGAPSKGAPSKGAPATRVPASSLIARNPSKVPEPEPEPAIEMEFVAELGTDLLTDTADEPMPRSEPQRGFVDTSRWPDLSDELAEIRFFVDQGLEDDAELALAELRKRHPGHPALQTGAPQAAAEDHPRHSDGAKPLVDLASDEDEEAEAYLSAIFGGEDAHEPAASKSQVGVKANVTEGDARTYFDLGTAYREMGLVDESITQFELAADDPTWRSRALTMAATLRAHRGEAEEAVAQLKQAVATANTEDERCEAAYELATVYERLGNTGAAVEQLKTVTAGYRDRDERLSALLT